MANCGGPDGFKWDGEKCVTSGSQTSCDSVAQETCFYAYLQNIELKTSEVSGRLVPGGGLKISDPGDLAEIGIAAGDVVSKVNGVLLSDSDAIIAALAAFTPTAPATLYSAEHLAGKYQLSLSH